MRVISGTARGTKLFTLEGEETRPTLDRVKESAFNIIQNKIQDSVVLDLFAGSGAISLEFASRGAKTIIACDKSRKAINIIHKNIEKTHMNNKIDVYNIDYLDCLKKQKDIKFDLIYLDPPYKTDYAIKAIKKIIELKLFQDETLIIVETDDPNIIREIEKETIQIVDKRKYGRAIVTFLKVSNYE